MAYKWNTFNTSLKYHFSVPIYHCILTAQNWKQGAWKSIKTKVLIIDNIGIPVFLQNEIVK